MDTSIKRGETPNKVLGVRLVNYMRETLNNPGVRRKEGETYEEGMVFTYLL